MVRRFVAAGSRVLAVGRDTERMAALRDAAAGRGGRAARRRPHRRGGGDGALRPRRGRGGPLAAVVHLVGGFRYAPLADTTDADWAFLWRTNVETSFLVCRECARRFAAAGGGVLVAVSAPAALAGAAGVGGYAAAKAAVLRLVESLAREMAPFGGRANAVLPGTMDTAANRRAMPDADPARWASTDDVAAVIHHLTTPEARAVNGAAIRVPGPSF